MGDNYAVFFILVAKIRMSAMKNSLFRRGMPVGAILAIVFLFSSSLHAEEAADAQESFERGTRELAKKRFDSAIAEFTEALKLRPTEAKYHGMLAAALLEKGDYEKGVPELKTAIELHPNDVGAKYRSQSDKKLSDAALKHGREQVKKMLADRPAMAEHPAEAEFLRKWATRKFAGEDLDSLIDWDPEPPTDSDAEHTAPDETSHGSIQVHPNYMHGRKEGQPRNFEELWAGAVYELHNINNAKYFVELHKKAADGKLTKEEFVGGIVKHEVVAAQETRAFYLNVFLPFAEKQKLATQPSLWFAQWWDQPDEALKGFSNRSVYPWQPYARQYDWLTVDHHFKTLEYEKAIQLLKEMCEDIEGQDDHADVHLMLGRCRMQLNQHKEAVEEFDTAAKMIPDYADIYRYRAEAYFKLGEKEKAQADEAKFKELSK
jgi:tetratricopeptide (TPR) repeat protein